MSGLRNTMDTITPLFSYQFKNSIFFQVTFNSSFIWRCRVGHNWSNLAAAATPNLDIFSHKQNDAIETNFLSIHLFLNAFDQLNWASVTKGKKSG